MVTTSYMCLLFFSLKINEIKNLVPQSFYPYFKYSVTRNFFVFSRATPMAYGGSQTRGLIREHRPPYAIGVALK